MTVFEYWDGRRMKRKLELTTTAVGPLSAQANNSSFSQVTTKENNFKYFVPYLLGFGIIRKGTLIMIHVNFVT